MKEELRRVKVSGHQYFCECWFHRFYETSDNGLVVILESDDGRLFSKEFNMYQFEFVNN